MKKSFALLAGITVLSFTAFAAPEAQGTASDASSQGSSQQVFTDDFAKANDAWRYGNAIRSAAGCLPLSAYAPEVTLSPTAVNPENLAGFSAIFRWNFGAKEKREFRIGWGKPFEFSAFSECVEQLAIGADGVVTLFADGKKIGTVRAVVGDKGDAALTFSRRPDSVVLDTDGHETVFPIPLRGHGAAGYMALRVQGVERGQPPLKLQHVEIRCDGKRPPQTERERAAGQQLWAAQKLRGNRERLEALGSYLQAESGAGRWGFKTDIAVEPGLVKPGEKVRVTFRRTGALPQPCSARVEPDFLSGQPGQAQPVALRWRESEGTFEAVAELKPDRCGNWRVVWQAGDEQLTRVFAVADRGYAVCRFLVTSDRALGKANPAPAAHDAIHDAGLAADYWMSSPLGATPESGARNFRKYAEFRHRWGDQFMPLCNADWILPGCPDSNLWRFGDDVQREGFRQAAQAWELLGLGPLHVLASYTFGHSTPRIARSVGVKMLDSLVQWQNWRDGGDDNAWLINQWGAPTVPYYVADDDYRKVARGRSIVAFTQATTSSARIYYINMLEGQPQLNDMRRRHYSSPQTNGDMAETHNSDRFETTVDLWLAEAPYLPEPMFLSVGLENFVDSSDWNEANRRGVRYLCEQAKSSRIVFAQAAAIADFYQRYYRHQPESWFYWPDIYAGLLAGHKLRQIPDRIELSNADFHSLHEDGAVLPRFLWDFTRPWEEPVWDDQRAIRQKFGLVTLELLNATNCVPRMVDLSGVTATVAFETQPWGVTALVRVDTPRDLSALPLGLWRIPLKAGSCEASRLPRGVRFVPVVDGSTANFHGVLVCGRVAKGPHVWTFRLRGEPQRPLEPCFRVGDDVRGRSFHRPSGATAYVWLADGCPRTGTLAVSVPDGRQASVHYNDGQIAQPRDGVLHVTLDRAWQHEAPMIMGLTAAEIQTGAEFHAEAGDVQNRPN